MKNINASIVGASGYAGIELTRLLSIHPHVHLQQLVSETHKNTAVTSVFPHLEKKMTHFFEAADMDKLAQGNDIVFLAMGHKQSEKYLQPLLDNGCKIIDLSADLRLNEGNQYPQWYQMEAIDASIRSKAVYGLPEIVGERVLKTAQIVANPGCYATASILALAPLWSGKDIVNPSIPIIVDGKSGVSGAGRVPAQHLHFSEAMNNFSAYQVGGIHRHTPEIEQELSKIAQQPIVINFTPHLIPTVRGMMITAYVPLQHSIALADVVDVFEQFYNNAPFVRIFQNQDRPNIKQVIGSNFCDITIKKDARTNLLIVIACIDNLIKGAAGQAVQNMNILFDQPQTTGLLNWSIYP